MNLIPLKVAVVGHTNTGKTSLLRTLLRDVNFGEVSDRPATTRHVEGAVILVHRARAIELYDTPGLEDSIGLLDYLNGLQTNSSLRTDGGRLIHEFLTSDEALHRFSQEAKALRQVLASDAALYVIDARDRVLGKHRDELTILGYCAKPVIPVLNFIASPDAQTVLWREHLSRVGMHAVAEFDTVVIDDQSERRLLEKMRSMLDSHRVTIDAVIHDRAQQRQQLIHASAVTIAELLIDVAALKLNTPIDDAAQAAERVDHLKQRIRHREQEAVDQLVALHRFRTEDFEAADLPLIDGKWGVDLFSPAALKQFGIRTGSAAAAGAMAGLTIDAMVGGLSLGAGAAIGAAIGALLGTGQTHGRRIIDRMRGRNELRCDDATIQLLFKRSVWLIESLLHRGHAAINTIEVKAAMSNPPASRDASASLQSMLDECRLHPNWSRLNEPPYPPALTSGARQSVVERMTRAIESSGAWSVRPNAV